MGGWFQVLFHSPSGVLFTVPSRYWSTIGQLVVFSLGRWSSQLHAVTRVRRYLGTAPEGLTLSPTGLSPSLVALSRAVRLEPIFVTSATGCPPWTGRPATPSTQRGQSFACGRFRLFRVRSPLLTESRLISLPPGTEMLHFPGFASLPYGFRERYRTFRAVGLPHSGIHGSTPARRLPVAYRSLPRPSSPPAAEASTVRPY